MADPTGKGGWGPVHLLLGIFSFFFFTKTKFMSKKSYVVLNEYKIYIKMLEMAILETHIFKKF